jgi:hypothetical protein
VSFPALPLSGLPEREVVLVSCENATDQDGQRLIWLPHAVLDRLNHLRGAGECFGDVIMRLAKERKLTKRTKVK